MQTAAQTDQICAARLTTINHLATAPNRGSVCVSWRLRRSRRVVAVRAGQPGRAEMGYVVPASERCRENVAAVRISAWSGRVSHGCSPGSRPSVSSRALSWYPLASSVPSRCAVHRQVRGPGAVITISGCASSNCFLRRTASSRPPLMTRSRVGCRAACPGAPAALPRAGRLLFPDMR